MTLNRIRKPNGLTLLELLVVVLIIGIIAVNTLPRFASSIAKHKLVATTQRLEFDINAAKQRAVRSGTTQQLTFYTSNDCYVIPDAHTLDRSTGLYVVKLNTSPYDAKLIAAQFGTPPADSFFFSGYGIPNTGGSVTLQVGSFQQTLTVETDTGRTQVGAISQVP